MCFSIIQNKNKNKIHIKSEKENKKKIKIVSVQASHNTWQMTPPELLYMLTLDFCLFGFHFEKTSLTTEIFFLFLFLTITLFSRS